MPTQTTTLLLTLLLFSLDIARAGNPIRTFDDHILCFGHPPGDEAGWPNGYSTADYRDSMAFCSAVFGVPGRNVGCKCPGPNQLVDCSTANGADPNLIDNYWLHAPAFGGTTVMKEWCEQSCACYDFDLSTEYAHETPAEQAQTQGQPDTNLGAEEGAQAPPVAEPQAPDRAPGVTLTDGPVNLTAMAAGMGDVAANAQKCGQSCKIGDDCTGAECLCQAKSAKYEPSAGIVEYVAKCTLVELGKRGERAPCPCNETYVSHACCGVRDGRVWEAPHLKLGELRKGEL